jgi:THO complex subunit 4
LLCRPLEYGFSPRFATASRCGLTLRLQEYFSKSVGPVKKVLLNYNKNGRSVGVATIIFSQAQSAAEAAKKLDSVKVDGKPMRVSSCCTGSWFRTHANTNDQIEVILGAKYAPTPAAPKSLGDRIQ